MSTVTSATAARTEQWFFTVEELQDSPSVRDGLLPAEESEARWKGSSFIQDTGKHLKMPMIAIASALTFFNRFYARRSLRKYDHMILAGACLFLSGKVEEASFRKLRDIIRYTCMARMQRRPPDEDSEEFIYARKSLLAYEQSLMEALCFDLVLEHPHKTLLEILEKARDVFKREVFKKVGLSAWKLLNDTFRTQLTLLTSAPVIAHGVFYLTLEHILGDVHVKLGGGDQYWWQEVNLKSDELELVCKCVFQLYENSPEVSFFRDKHISLEARIQQLETRADLAMFGKKTEEEGKSVHDENETVDADLQAIRESHASFFAASNQEDAPQPYDQQMEESMEEAPLNDEDDVEMEIESEGNNNQPSSHLAGSDR